MPIRHFLDAGNDSKSAYCYTTSPALFQELRNKGLGWLVDDIPIEFSRNTGIPKDLLAMAAAFVSKSALPMQVCVQFLVGVVRTSTWLFCT